MLDCFNLKKPPGILSCHDIVILPFEGQTTGAPKRAATVPTAPAQTGSSATPGTSPNQQRRTVSRPTGKLTTANVGIKSTLNPPQKKKGPTDTAVTPDLAEDFTFEQLERVWKEYALGVKRERKDSLYSTLTTSKLTISSDYQINLEIVNTVQAAELDREKSVVLGFLRKRLKNYQIGLGYTITEKKKVQVLDNKGIFEQLAEENTSLNKFRKLFNLDIEF